MTENISNECVLIYRSLRDAVKVLSLDSRDAVIMAVLDYGLDNVEPAQLTGIELAIFTMVKPTIDKANAKYRAQCENGKKGGAPMGNKNAFKKTTQKQPKTTQNNHTYTDTYTDTYTYTDTDKNNKDTIVSSTESDFANLPPLPLVSGDFFRITSSDLEKYKTLYSGIDVEQQSKNMVGWLDANPKNRKTRNGIKRFISGWLSKEQNSAPRVNRKNTNETTTADVLRQMREMEERGELK